MKIEIGGDEIEVDRTASLLMIESAEEYKTSIAIYHIQSKSVQVVGVSVGI